MKALKFFTYILALAFFFVCGLYGGPVLKSTWSKVYPEPEYTTGDFSDLYKSENNKIVIFSSSTCPFCKAAREFLSENKLNYTEYLIDRDEIRNTEFTKLGGSVVPLIFIGNRRIEGFNVQTIQSAIKAIN